jgi:hypothetical protein
LSGDTGHATPGVWHLECGHLDATAARGIASYSAGRRTTVAPLRSKALRIGYWVATGVLCAMMLFSATTYVARYPRVANVFVSLGFPTYLIYPLAVAKILGVLAILSKRSRTLKEWAYAGFFFDFVLALSAHLVAGDSQFAPAAVALLLLGVSYGLDRKLYA